MKNGLKTSTSLTHEVEETLQNIGLFTTSISTSKSALGSLKASLEEIDVDFKWKYIEAADGIVLVTDSETNLVFLRITQ